MRIISGKLKGRRFEMPSNKWKTRPTTDIAREGLFNILQHSIDIEGIVVLDLYAGTGSVGYEFLSRSANSVTFVDKFADSITFIKNQLKAFDISNNAKTIKSDVIRFLENLPEKSYDIIFADPPYDAKNMMEIVQLVFKKNILKENGLLIIEHDDRNNFEKHPNFVFVRKYGQSRFSLFRLPGSLPQ